MLIESRTKPFKRCRNKEMFWLEFAAATGEFLKVENQRKSLDLMLTILFSCFLCLSVQWLYAFQITPMAEMTKAELIRQPDLTTESPLASAQAAADAVRNLMVKSRHVTICLYEFLAVKVA